MKNYCPYNIVITFFEHFHFRNWLICLQSRYDLKITNRFSLKLNLNFKDIFLLNNIVNALPVLLSL